MVRFALTIYPYSVEKSFGTSIEQLQTRSLTIDSYRDKAAKALVQSLARPESQESVIALHPSGLMSGYLRVIKKSRGITVLASEAALRDAGIVAIFRDGPELAKT